MRRVEDHRKKRRQHRLADALGEGLAFGFVLLAVAFDAMAENLVKENARARPEESPVPQKDRRAEPAADRSDSCRLSRPRPESRRPWAAWPDRRSRSLHGRQIHAVGGLAGAVIMMRRNRRPCSRRCPRWSPAFSSTRSASTETCGVQRARILGELARRACAGAWPIRSG